MARELRSLEYRWIPELLRYHRGAFASLGAEELGQGMASWGAADAFLAEHQHVVAARVKREVRHKLDIGLKNPRSASVRHNPRKPRCEGRS